MASTLFLSDVAFANLSDDEMQLTEGGFDFRGYAKRDCRRSRRISKCSCQGS